jgi:hypothetical protein
MIQLKPSGSQYIYLTLNQILQTSSIDNPVLLVQEKATDNTSSFNLGFDLSNNPTRYNKYQFTGSLNGGQYDYFVYSASILLEKGLLNVSSSLTQSSVDFTVKETVYTFK